MDWTRISTAAARSPADGDVRAAIQRASARTGVEFGYLFNQAKLESGLDPTVRARTSSATGLFQFIDQTWLGTISKHGAEHGLGWAAGAIHQGRDGCYYVSDPAARQAILDLRKDPDAASAMAAALASDNGAALERTLGRKAEPVDLYLAHFLGAGGAATFLRAHDSNPDAPAAALLPQAARANRAIFFDRTGAQRSVAEIRDRFAARLSGSAAPPPARLPAGGKFIPLRMAALQAGTGTAAVGPRPSPQYARLAYLMLADLGG